MLKNAMLKDRKGNNLGERRECGEGEGRESGGELRTRVGQQEIEIRERGEGRERDGK